MNEEIAQLLREAGITGPLDWRTIVMLFNYAPLPPPRVRHNHLLWQRGFNLAVLRHGQPAFFVKCRPTGDAVLERETAIRSALAGDRRSGLSIGQVRAAASERIAIQVTPFLRGPHYGSIVSGLTTSAYLESLRTVLNGAAELATLALRNCSVVQPPTPTVRLATAAADTLADIGKLASLDDSQYEALAAVIAQAGEVPPRPQHGDFWWQNLLMVDGHLWAIDFDSYGEIQVPLYDDLTLVCSTLSLRSGDEGPVRLLADDAEARACRALLVDRATAEGLTASQLDAVLVYYAVHMACTVERRNGGPRYSGPHMSAVRHIARRLARGERGLLAPAPAVGKERKPPPVARGSSARPSLLAVAAMPILPVRNGYSLRASNILRELSASWRVTLIAPLGNSSERDITGLGVERVVPMTLFGDWNASVSAADRQEIRYRVNQVILEEAPDAALVWAGGEVAALDNPAFPPTVLDRLDSEVVMAWRELRQAQGLRNRLRAVRDALVWAKHERALVRSFAETIVESETDARMLRLVSGRASVHVVSNGVAVQPRAATSEEAPIPTVVFTGSLSYTPNVLGVRWFVQSVWPRVRAAVPTARFVVAGWDPDPEILALGSEAGVDIVGEVADMGAVLRGAWLAVAPVWTGSGIRTKVLEAWAVGRPVVLSPVTASGLHMDARTASLIGRSARETARLVEHLLTNAKARHQLGEAAHSTVAREYGGWQERGARITALLRAATTMAAKRNEAA